MTPEVIALDVAAGIAGWMIGKCVKLRRRLREECELRIRAERLAATYASDADNFRRVIRERHVRS